MYFVIILTTSMGKQIVFIKKTSALIIICVKTSVELGKKAVIRCIFKVRVLTFNTFVDSYLLFFSVYKMPI